MFHILLHLVFRLSALFLLVCLAVWAIGSLHRDRERLQLFKDISGMLDLHGIDWLVERANRDKTCTKYSDRGGTVYVFGDGCFFAVREAGVVAGQRMVIVDIRVNGQTEFQWFGLAKPKTKPKVVRFRELNL